MFRNTRMISSRCLSALLFRDRPDRLGSLILAGFTVDHALESILDRTGLEGPKPLSRIDIEEIVSECREMVDRPGMEFRMGEQVHEVRRCCYVSDARKAVKCALATLSRVIDGRWRDVGELRDLLRDANVLVDMRGIAVLRWRSDTISRDYDAYLDEWRPRMPPRHGVGLREIDEIEADFNVIETYLVYTVPCVLERASPSELQASFRPRPAALVSREGGMWGRNL